MSGSKYTPVLAGKHLVFTVNASLIKAVGGGKTHKDELAAQHELLPILLKIVKTPGLKFLSCQPEFVTNYHIQGYMELERLTKFKQIREWWGCAKVSLYLANRAGSFDEAVAYTKKADSRWDNEVITPIYLDMRTQMERKAWNDPAELKAAADRFMDSLVLSCMTCKTSDVTKCTSKAHLWC